MNLRNIAIVTVLLALSGCAATVTRTQNEAPIAVDAAARTNVIVTFGGTETAVKSKDWESFKDEWRGALTAAAQAAGAKLTIAAGVPTPSTEPGTRVDIYVNDYRYVSAGARYGLGIFTGNAFVNSKIQFKDAQTGKSFGDRAFNTSSSAWQGVFSAMTEKQLEAISKEIFVEINGK